MKPYLGWWNSALVSSAVVVMAAQPVWAAPVQVTAVKVNPTASGVEVVLEAQTNETTGRPQVFTVNRGTSWVADITNTQLRLPQSSNFRQDNPAPGINSVLVVPLDTNSVRLIVTGKTGVPAGQLTQRDRGGLVFSLNSSATSPTAVTPPGSPTAQVPTPTVPNPTTPPPANPATPPRNPNVAPPFLPRAVAPPVGDIAISNINVTTSSIDLGTAERVPRLVLRNAPAREVLSLLARAANLNIAFAEGTGGASSPAASPSAPAASAPATSEATISLDVENEPVQDVFNYVLRITGLQANRVGRTIFVGQNLPLAARNVVMRTLRLNQMKATLPETNITTTSTSASNLSSAGASGGASTNSQLGRTSNLSQNIPIRGALQILESLGATPLGGAAGTAPTAPGTSDAPRVLQGLQATADSRTNTITLIGPPDLVEIATQHLVKLDVRKRQVAVNVKIVEVNLTNGENIGSSFSFGIANSFFSVDRGNTTANFGDYRPPTASEVRTSQVSPTVVNNGLVSSQVLGTLDANGNFIPNTIFSPNGSPTTPGISEADVPDPTPLSDLLVAAPPGPGDIPLYYDVNGVPRLLSELIPGGGTFAPLINAAATTTRTTLTGKLPSVFQYSKSFLAQLQAQITSNNAKILTDPTLIVQEGSQSQVNLTSQVFSGFTEQRRTEGNLTTTSIIPGAPIDVGVILNVNVDQIDDNGFITLSVSPEVSSPGDSITDPSRNNLLIQQLVNRRRLETGNIRLRDGQTLILTGVIQEQDRVQATKTPILGDLPLIGALFRGTVRNNTRSEVVVLVTPQIMDDSDRSSYGYSYTPSPEVNQILRQRSGR